MVNAAVCDFTIDLKQISRYFTVTAIRKLLYYLYSIENACCITKYSRFTFSKSEA